MPRPFGYAFPMLKLFAARCEIFHPKLFYYQDLQSVYKLLYYKIRSIM